MARVAVAPVPAPSEAATTANAPDLTGSFVAATPPAAAHPERSPVSNPSTIGRTAAGSGVGVGTGEGDGAAVGVESGVGVGVPVGAVSGSEAP